MPPVVAAAEEPAPFLLTLHQAFLAFQSASDQLKPILHYFVSL